MRTYIKLWGKEYMVLGVWWNHSNLNVDHISFIDENDKQYTIFNKKVDGEPNRSDRFLHADLNKVLIWKEK